MPRKVKTMNPISNYIIIERLLTLIPIQEENEEPFRWNLTSNCASINKEIFDYYGLDLANLNYEGYRTLQLIGKVWSYEKYYNITEDAIAIKDMSPNLINAIWFGNFEHVCSLFVEVSKKCRRTEKRREQIRKEKGKDAFVGKAIYTYKRLQQSWIFKAIECRFIAGTLPEKYAHKVKEEYFWLKLMAAI